MKLNVYIAASVNIFFCMKSVFSVIILVCLTIVCFAQNQLVFTNIKTGKMIYVKPGQTLSMNYAGYLGQTEFIKSMVYEINDSVVTFLMNGPGPGIFGNGIPDDMRYKTIRISDIRSFRRMTVARQLVKSITMTGLIVGTYIVLYNYYRNGKASLGEGFLVSLGIAVGTRVLIESIFPEMPKYKISEGWTATVIHP
jgi:hypothetical protein